MLFIKQPQLHRVSSKAYKGNVHLVDIQLYVHIKKKNLVFKFVPLIIIFLNQKTYSQYPQLRKLSQIGHLKSPIGHNIPNWGLGIYESGNAESEKKSPIPNWIKYLQLDKISPIGDLNYPIGDIIPNWVFSSVSPLISLHLVSMFMYTQWFLKFDL